MIHVGLIIQISHTILDVVIYSTDNFSSVVKHDNRVTKIDKN